MRAVVRCGLVALLVIAAGGGHMAGQARRVPRLAIVAAHNHFDILAAARTLAGRLQVDVFGTSNEPGLRSAKDVSLADYDLVFAEGGGNQFLFAIEALESAKARTKVMVVKTDLMQGNVPVAAHPWVEKYWAFPSAANLQRLLTYFGGRILGLPMVPEPPTEYPTAGFYHPDAPAFFDTASAYLSWHAARIAPPRSGLPGRLRIGVAFNSLDHLKGQTAVVDALVREIERQGHDPVPLMFAGALPLDRFQDTDGTALVDAVVTTSTRIDWYDTRAGVQAARRLGVPLLDAINHYRLTPEEWRASASGLSPDLTYSLAMAERDGLIEPIVVSAKRVTPESGDTKVPLPDQIAWRVRRAVAWGRLRRTPNAEKRVVVTFYAEGGGKGNVGSDLDYYLDVQGSLARLLPAMRERGYDVGDGPLPDLTAISRDLSRRASNVGNWAPGEIARRVAAGDVDLVPAETYEAWFNQLPAEKRAQVVTQWGPPPGRIMVHTDDRGRRFLVMPRLAYGNLLVVPHPDWGHLQDRAAMFARSELPPNHQYIAFFLWLRKEKRPDAWLSLFSNLVLQGGKMEGPAVNDWTALLQGDMPLLLPTPLHGNGGMSSKRRTLGVTATFTPSIVYSDLYGDLLELQDKLGRYRDQPDGALRASYLAGIRDEARRLHLDRDLDIDIAGLAAPDLVARLQAYLTEIRTQHMPGGSHVLGVAPAGAARVEMVTAMLGREFTAAVAAVATDAPLAARQLVSAVIDEHVDTAAAQQRILGRVVPGLGADLGRASDYAARLDATAQELPRLLDVLDGRYLEPGPINDPVRNPDALPPGRNAYQFDPSAMPTREAWKTASGLVEQLLAQYQAKHGVLPRKVGFVLWSAEATANLGVNEAQMLHLLGVRPVWSSTGRVVDVELIPAAELGRPRVDVFATTSGLYRDHFLDKMVLLDKAVKLAAAATAEPDNGVAARTAEIASVLRASGEPAAEAAALATARIFSEAVGSYSPNIQFLAESGDYFESKQQMTELYGSRMSHVYGAGRLGQFNRQVFTANLAVLDAAAFSRSSNVLGTLEHPMVAAYFGGMGMASQAVSGRTPEMFITNLADPGAARTESLTQYFNRELRSRYFNPKWVENMMARGYEGSRFPAAFASHLHLWDITTPELVTSEHWQETRDVYVRDTHGLGLAAFFERENPFARQSIVATLLEAASDGDWAASEAETLELATALAESAATHGLACAAELCRNQALVERLRGALTASADTAPLFDRFQAALDAVRPPTDQSAAPAPSGRLRAPTSRAVAAPSRPSTVSEMPASPVAPASRAASAAPSEVRGRLMESAPPSSAPPGVAPSLLALMAGGLFVTGLLGVGWWRGGTWNRKDPS
jgi:cobaltochelatase CobN